MISRRSAATSMASILFSVTTAPPALAADADENEATVASSDSIKTIATTDDASAVDDPTPVAAKEKMVEYIVQDFTVALPANWKVITKYDEKAVKKLSSTPTLFSAIDFNSGAVISIVKEEGCSINEYAKSAFETSKNKKTGPAKKTCNFVLKNEEGVFSAETFKKDASKLLIRHDDRDNAVFRGVSTIEESNLVGEPSSYSASSKTTSSTWDSYASSLLELRATTTIPTSGTYRDTMGLEQPNTIDRKVLAKAVATTTIVTTRKTDADANASAEVVLPPATESRLLVKSDTIDKNSALVVSKKSDPPMTTAAAATGTTTAEATAATASVSSSDVGINTAGKSPSTFTAEVTSTPKDLFEKYSDVNSNVPPKEEANSVESSSKTHNEAMVTTLASTTAPATKGSDDSASALASSKVTATAETSLNQPMIESATVTTTPTPTSTDSMFQESTPISSTAKTSPMAGMMAMTTTILEVSDEGASADAVLKALRAEAIESAVKIVKEIPMETAKETVKETAIEPAIEKVKETAKETAKEMALELVNGMTEPQKASEDASTAAASAIVPPPGQVPQLATSTTQSTSTPQPSATSSEVSATPIAADTIAPLEPPRTMALTSDMNASPSDAKLVASASSTGTPVNANANANVNANESLAATTTTNTVLSIWLSAPSDEWQKPVMGTKLNQIWESVKYTSNVVESSDNNLAMLDTDEDDLNAQLLLMNKGAFR